MREREREQGKVQRERIPSRLLAVSVEPDTGLDLTNREIMIMEERILADKLNFLPRPVETPWCFKQGGG